MKIKELCKDDRPREKMLEKGADALSNAELIAILLRTGTREKNAVETARDLLAQNDGKVSVLASTAIERLCSIRGIGKGKAVTLAAAFELGKRQSIEENGNKKFRIASPRDAYRVLLPILKNLDVEECWVIYLNKGNYILGKEMISRGGMESTVIDNKLIIRKILEKKASGIILAHNHPSGTALPSVPDITQTKLLQKALKTCEIDLVDHIIIGGGEYYSFSDEIVSSDIG